MKMLLHCRKEEVHGLSHLTFYQSIDLSRDLFLDLFHGQILELHHDLILDLFHGLSSILGLILEQFPYLHHGRCSFHEPMLRALCEPVVRSSHELKLRWLHGLTLHSFHGLML